jgi:hypothetical protein
MLIIGSFGHGHKVVSDVGGQLWQQVSSGMWAMENILVLNQVGNLMVVHRFRQEIQIVSVME